MTLPSEIEDLSEDDDYVNCLIVGHVGVGKTVFAASTRSLILDFDRGVASAARIWKGSTHAKRWDCLTWNRWLRAKKWISAQQEIPFDWLVIDSVNSLQRRFLKKILADEYEKSRHTSNPRDIDLPQIQDHQLWQNRYRSAIEWARDLPIDTLFTSIPMIVQDDDANDRILPQLLGKDGVIAEWTMAQMSCIGYMERKSRESDGSGVDRKYTQITWESDGTLPVKDRYGTLGPSTENITLADLSALARHHKE